MTKRAPRPSRNQLRIIGGKWRGRKLDFPSVEGLRPTGDRIRETLFNWLMPELPGARCLDLFAGSGALGLEALSRGAASVVMLDSDPQVITYLRRHCETLKADNVMVQLGDALSWLGQQAASTFDIVFVDPPFDSGLLEPVTRLLNEKGLLSDGALVYVEIEQGGSFTPPGQWQLFRQKSAGQVSFSLYRVSDSPA